MLPACFAADECRLAARASRVSPHDPIIGPSTLDFVNIPLGAPSRHDRCASAWQRQRRGLKDNQSRERALQTFGDRW